MKTKIFLNYLKYYNIYHLAIFYTMLILINMTIGIVSNIAECQPPELKPYIQDPTFIPDKDIKGDGLVQGVYGSNSVKRPVTDSPYMKPIVDANYRLIHNPYNVEPRIDIVNHTPAPSSWSIEYKMKLFGGYIISWFSPESWYQWYNKDSILAQQADQVKEALKTQLSPSINPQVPNGTMETTPEIHTPNKSNNLVANESLISEELKSYFDKIVKGLENIENSSPSHKVMLKKIYALLPPIDINTDNYTDIRLNIQGKYEKVIDGIGNYGIQNKSILIKHLIIQYQLNCFIYTALKETGIMMDKDGYYNMYQFLFDQYTKNYGF